MADIIANREVDIATLAKQYTTIINDTSIPTCFNLDDEAKGCMLTKQGNDKINELVRLAYNEKWSSCKARSILHMLSQYDGYSEATDTPVLEYVICALGYEDN